MPSVASSIFKIRAHTDFISDDPTLLSFRKGQPFYALSVDHDRGIFFVSTQFAVPFSRNAVCGMVPKQYFDQVDLLAKDPPVQRNAPVKIEKKLYVPTRRESMTNNVECQNLISIPISFIQVLSSTLQNNVDCYKIQVTRTNVTHTVTRDAAELSQFNNHLLSMFPINAVPQFPPLEDMKHDSRLQRLELYLNSLIAQPYKPTEHTEQISHLLNQLFIPRDATELASQQIPRRDSGQSMEEPQKKKKSFARFTSMMFGL